MDNFTIVANFEDTLTFTPITDGNLTINWSGFLNEVPMQNLNNGTYIYNLQSTSGDTSGYILTISAQKANYVFQSTELSLNILTDPTTVNGTSVFSSYSQLYVTTSHIIFYYDFDDTYHGVPVSGLSVNYQLENQPDTYSVNGTLIYQDGEYVLDPLTQDLPLGLYDGVLTFIYPHYSSSYAFIEVEVDAIPAQINSSSIQQTPYSEYWGNQFQLNFNYTNSLQSTSISGAQSLFQISGQTLGSPINGNLSEVELGIYQFSLNSTTIPLGIYAINVRFSMTNYTAASATFNIQFNSIPTAINSTNISQVPYTNYWGSQFQINFNYTNSLQNSSITGAQSTFQISGQSLGSPINGSLSEIQPGIYQFSLNSMNIPLGIYAINTSFASTNYTSVSATFNVQFIPIPGMINNTNIQQVPYIQYWGSQFQLNFNYSNGLQSTPISGAQSIFQISGQPLGSPINGSLSESQPGIYTFSLDSKSIPLGVFAITTSFSMTNYTSASATFNIEFLSIPTSINNTGTSNIPIGIYWGNQFEITYVYSNSLTNNSIANASCNYQITGPQLSLGSINGNLVEITSGVYAFDLNSTQIPLGTYGITLSFTDINYTTCSATFSIQISQVPIITGLYLQQNQVLTPVSTNVSITIAQSLVLIAYLFRYLE